MKTYILTQKHYNKALSFEIFKGLALDFYKHYLGYTIKKG
jgi:hypothetical protein